MNGRIIAGYSYPLEKKGSGGQIGKRKVSRDKSKRAATRKEPGDEGERRSRVFDKREGAREREEKNAR